MDKINMAQNGSIIIYDFVAKGISSREVKVSIVNPIIIVITFRIVSQAGENIIASSNADILNGINLTNYYNPDDILKISSNGSDSGAAWYLPKDTQKVIQVAYDNSYIFTSGLQAGSAGNNFALGFTAGFSTNNVFFKACNLSSSGMQNPLFLSS